MDEVLTKVREMTWEGLYGERTEGFEKERKSGPSSTP